MRMITHNPTQRGEIVLCHAGESLVQQLTEWAGRNPTAALRLATCCGPTSIRALLAGASGAIVDVTEDPRAALETFCCAVSGRGTSAAVSVYTEKMHDGLEMFVRLRGAMLLLGPMEPDEWDGFCRDMLRNAPAAARSVTGDIHHNPYARLRLVSKVGLPSGPRLST